MSAYRPVEAKVGGWCDRCREKFEAGAQIVFLNARGEKVRRAHAICAEKSGPEGEVERKASPNARQIADLSKLRERVIEIAGRIKREAVPGDIFDACADALAQAARGER